MEKRSFILGLGVGIVFSVMIIWVAFGFSDFGKEELSNQEIEARAKNLGMDYILTESQTETVSEIFNEKKTEKTVVNTTDSFSVETTKNDLKNNLEINLEVTSEVSSEISLELISEQDSETTYQLDDELIDVTITSGSNAKQVSLVLQERGVVKSAEEFEKYLIDNHKTKNIKTGNYKIIKYIDFKTLSDIITKRQN